MQVPKDFKQAPPPTPPTANNNLTRFGRGHFLVARLVPGTYLRPPAKGRRALAWVGVLASHFTVPTSLIMGNCQGVWAGVVWQLYWTGNYELEFVLMLISNIFPRKLLYLFYYFSICITVIPVRLQAFSLLKPVFHAIYTSSPIIMIL